MTDKIIHHTVPSQLSRFLNEEYPLFVLFIQKYYEWLETPGTPYHLIREHLSYLNFKDSIEEYLSLMKNEYLFGLPEDILVDRELLIKHAKQIYSIIGTEKAYKFLFRILYDEDVEIIYPKDNILRGSDGKWIDDEQVMYLTSHSDIDSLLYTKIVQYKEETPGVVEEASATIQRITRKYSGRFNFVELSLTNVRGTFNYNFPIKNEGIDEWILPIGSPLILNPGLNYTTNNPLTYNGDSTWFIEYKCPNNGEANGRYTTSLTKDDISVFVNDNKLIDFDYDGTTIYSDEITLGSIIRIVYPIYQGRSVIKQVNGTTNGIEEISIIDTPFGIIKQENLTTSGGLGGSVVYIPSTVRRVSGYFSNVDGFLSERSIVLQDSFYYQDFSYVLKTGLDTSVYKDIVDLLLHPSGMMMFGQIAILEEIVLSVMEIELLVSINGTNVSDVIEAETTQPYTTNGFIDDMKEFFDTSYRITAYPELTVDDMIYRNQMHLNTPDSSVTISTEAEGEGYWLSSYMANDDEVYIV